MRLPLKNQILSKFNIKDSNFGLFIDMSPHLPDGCTHIKVSYIISHDEPDNPDNPEDILEAIHETLLPHQFYISNIIEHSKLGNIESIRVTPIFNDIEILSSPDLDEWS